MQDSLPAGGLRLCRAGVEPAGSLREVSVHGILLSRAYPGAISVRSGRGRAAARAACALSVAAQRARGGPPPTPAPDRRCGARIAQSPSGQCQPRDQRPRAERAYRPAPPALSPSRDVQNASIRRRVAALRRTTPTAAPDRHSGSGYMDRSQGCARDRDFALALVGRAQLSAYAYLRRGPAVGRRETPAEHRAGPHCSVIRVAAIAGRYGWQLDIG